MGLLRLGHLVAYEFPAFLHPIQRHGLTRKGASEYSASANPADPSSLADFPDTCLRLAETVSGFEVDERHLKEPILWGGFRVEVRERVRRLRVGQQRGYWLVLRAKVFRIRLESLRRIRGVLRA
jgi:hypothetical protein